MILRVARALFAFVLHRIEQQAFVLLKDGQHRFARHGSPAAKDRGDLVFEEQFLGLLGEEVPVRGRVDDHRFDLGAEDAAGGIDFFDGHQHGVAQANLRNGHGTAERVQDTYFDGLFCFGLGAQSGGERGQDSQSNPKFIELSHRIPPG